MKRNPLSRLLALTLAAFLLFPARVIAGEPVEEAETEAVEAEEPEESTEADPVAVPVLPPALDEPASEAPEEQPEAPKEDEKAPADPISPEEEPAEPAKEEPESETDEEKEPETPEQPQQPEDKGYIEAVVTDMEREAAEAVAAIVAEDDAMEILQTLEVTAPEGTVFPAQIRFEAEVDEGMDILLLHFKEAENKPEGEWEEIEPELVEKGFITAVFESLSPVAVVLKTEPEETEEPAEEPEEPEDTEVQEETPEDAELTFTVTFYGFEDVILSEQRIVDGAGAVEPEIPEVDGYEFKGWDAEFAEIHGDLAVHAIYEEVTEEETETAFEEQEFSVTKNGVTYTVAGEMPKNAGLSIEHVSFDDTIEGFTAFGTFHPVILVEDETWQPEDDDKTVTVAVSGLIFPEGAIFAVYKAKTGEKVETDGKFGSFETAHLGSYVFGYVVPEEEGELPELPWADDFTYTLDEEQELMVIASYNGSGTEVTIPATFGEYGVALSGSVFSGNTDIESVIFEKNEDSAIRIIDETRMFAGCSSLQSVDFSGVVFIGGSDSAGMFEGCPVINKIVAPKIAPIFSLEQIADGEFYPAGEDGNLDYDRRAANLVCMQPETAYFRRRYAKGTYTVIAPEELDPDWDENDDYILSGVITVDTSGLDDGDLLEIGFENRDGEIVGSGEYTLLDDLGNGIRIFVQVEGTTHTAGGIDQVRYFVRTGEILGEEDFENGDYCGNIPLTVRSCRGWTKLL